MSKIACPCCGEFTRDKEKPLGFCPVCGWVYDEKQELDPNSRVGKNSRSLNETRAIVFAHRKNHCLY